ncbi:MAG: PorT family protein [Cytophagales bacterium]|nr:PorT family protein [Cytophagales bacterium]
MKKLLLFIVLGLISATAFSQQKYKIGLKATPLMFAWNRVVDPSEEPKKQKGLHPRFGAGVFFDYFFIGQNYAFSTGVTYAIKGGNIEYLWVDKNKRFMVEDKNIKEGGIKITRFVLQYIEIPVSVKLYTNEISTDMKLYFQVGISGNILISARVDNEKSILRYDSLKTGTDSTSSFKLTKNFFPIEASLVFSTGIELQMGENTYFFTGFTFNHGLTSIDRFFKKSPDEDGYGGHDIDGFVLKNSYFGIDVGLKF